MKKVIITGATGSIGSTLIDKLLKNNIKVYAIVRPNSKNINNLKENKNLTIIECDLSDILSLNEKLDNCDTFYHFGWSGTNKTDRLSIEKQAPNIENTLNAIKLAKKIGCKKFIFAGSQAEYGPKKELIKTTSEVNPNTAYGYAKYMAGYLGKKLCLELDIDFIWTRIFSVYGPKDLPYTMIKIVLSKMINNEDIDLTEGIQLWEYLHSEDIGNAFYLIGEKGVNTIYNVSSKTTLPLKEYILIMKEKTKTKSKINFGTVPYTTGIVNLNSDISELEKLGFKEEYDFGKGIEEILAKWEK